MATPVQTAQDAYITAAAKAANDYAIATSAEITKTAFEDAFANAAKASAEAAAVIYTTSLTQLKSHITQYLDEIYARVAIDAAATSTKIFDDTMASMPIAYQNYLDGLKKISSRDHKLL